MTKHGVLNMNSEMSYVAQCACFAILSEPAFKTSVVQSAYSSVQPVHQQIAVLFSSSMAASDSESHAISADWKTSDPHIDFASKISTISPILNSELLLFLHEWQ